MRPSRRLLHRIAVLGPFPKEQEPRTLAGQKENILAQSGRQRARPQQASIDEECPDPTITRTEEDGEAFRFSIQEGRCLVVAVPGHRVRIDLGPSGIRTQIEDDKRLGEVMHSRFTRDDHAALGTSQVKNPPKRQRKTRLFAVTPPQCHRPARKVACRFSVEVPADVDDLVRHSGMNRRRGVESNHRDGVVPAKSFR